MQAATSSARDLLFTVMHIDLMNIAAVLVVIAAMIIMKITAIHEHDARCTASAVPAVMVMQICIVSTCVLSNTRQATLRKGGTCPNAMRRGWSQITGLHQ